MINLTLPTHSKASVLIATISIALISSGCSNYSTSTTPQAVQQNHTNLGNVYTDNSGMTLYTFKKDKTNVSNCNNGCAVKWPPLLARDSATSKGNFSIITRADNSKQWALNGKPLYRWFKDKKPGDTTGEGIKSVWFVAKP